MIQFHDIVNIKRKQDLFKLCFYALLECFHHSLAVRHVSKNFDVAPLCTLCQSSCHLWYVLVISNHHTPGSPGAEHVTQQSLRYLWHTGYLLWDIRQGTWWIPRQLPDFLCLDLTHTRLKLLKLNCQASVSDQLAQQSMLSRSFLIYVSTLRRSDRILASLKCICSRRERSYLQELFKMQS